MERFLVGVPDTKRLLYAELRIFIEDIQTFTSPIGVISGLRKTGKTTLLKQLVQEYRECKRVLYLNFRDNVVYSSPSNESIEECNTEEAIYRFLSDEYTKYDLVLLDEITSLAEHEAVSGNLYDVTGSSGSGWRYKVLITGSSPFHLRSLSSGSLGAGRSKLFRLSVIKFVEYMHIACAMSYNDYTNVTRENFIDYLILKNLSGGVFSTFDRQYFSDYQNDIDIGEDTVSHSRGYAGLDGEDLVDLANVLAYQLAHRVRYDRIAKSNAGKHELGLLGGRKKYDLSHSLIAVSSKNIRRLKSDGLHEPIANLLHFLVGSDLVNVETELDSEDDVPIQPIRFFRHLRGLKTEKDFLEFFGKHSISVNSPLLYSRLGNDVLSYANLSLEQFFVELQAKANGLLGDMLEVYLRGGISELDTLGLPYVSNKLRIGHDAELDIVNTHLNIMCEATVKNKDHPKIYLAKHFKEQCMIRVCTTENLKGVRDCYHLYPWPEFCCMVDTRDVLKLPRTSHVDYLGNTQETTI